MDNSSIADFKLPVISSNEVSIKLPRAWPSKSLVVWKRYANISFIFSSLSDKLVITFLMSPTAGIWNSSRSFPVLCPLSATEITAVISRGKSFNPAKR